jgi:hypothetical protein
MSTPDGPGPRSQNVFYFALIGAFVAVIWALMIPNLLHPVENVNRHPCINNLRRIDGAKWTWALEHNKTNADVPTWADILPYLSRDQGNTNILKCPSGGVYTLGAVTSAPTCSIPGHALP